MPPTDVEGDEKLLPLVFVDGIDPELSALLESDVSGSWEDGKLDSELSCSDFDAASANTLIRDSLLDILLGFFPLINALSLFIEDSGACSVKALAS
jgi:hypothetical protein